MTLLLCFGWLKAQKYEVRSSVGVTYYQGDLSPLPVRFSFSKGHPAIGMSFGIETNKFFSIHTKFLKGTLSGTDSEASGQGRRRRNLHFETYLYEVGIISEFYFNAFIKPLDKYGIQLYYTTGINVFHFNPKARYNGEWVALQPLGTEGQGDNSLPGNKQKYSLTQVNLPFGLGVKFNLSNSLIMGFEVVPRMTFTDYLDDVSGEYVNYEQLKSSNGALSAALANRTGEYLESEPIQVATGTQRGDPNDNDWYLYTGMYFGYKVGVPSPAVIQKAALKDKPDL